MTKTSKNRHHVVIIGAGFGGIEVANQLAGAEVDVTIIDRRNHHLFQPLLYQVAGASLDIRDRLAYSLSIPKSPGSEHLDGGSGRYRPGRASGHSQQWLAPNLRHARTRDRCYPCLFRTRRMGAFAPGLKTLEDATTIRGRILAAFEEAERTSDPQQRAALQTFVIIGGGPTGVELADHRRACTRHAGA